MDGVKRYESKSYDGDIYEEVPRAELEALTTDGWLEIAGQAGYAVVRHVGEPGQEFGLSEGEAFGLVVLKDSDDLRELAPAPAAGAGDQAIPRVPPAPPN